MPAPDGVVIRAATAGDVDGIRRLVRAAYGGYVGRIGREPAPMKADYDSIVAGGDAWVAEVSGNVIGVLVLVAAADHLLLENIAVDPAVKGTGVGALMLAFTDDRARELNFGEVRLYTNAAMTENLDYYPNYGYVETHRSIVGGYDRVFFSKRLDTPCRSVSDDDDPGG